jgi:hypothetical protein
MRPSCGIGNASPWGSIGLAKQNFDTLAARARAGDQDAIRQLTAAGDQYLNYSRQYNASGTGYQKDLAYVLNTIDLLGDKYETQQNLEQMQLDALNAILNELKGLNVNIRDHFPWSQGGFGANGGGPGGINIIPPAPGGGGIGGIVLGLVLCWADSATAGLAGFSWCGTAVPTQRDSL